MADKKRSAAGGPATKASRPAGLAGLAGLAALRDQVPAGPEVRNWLVATRDAGATCGWIPVTRYRQTIGKLPDAALVIPRTAVTATVIEAEDGRVMLQIVGFSLTVAAADGGRVEETTDGASVHVDGRAVTRVGCEIEIAPHTQLAIRGGPVLYRLQLAPQQPAPLSPSPPPRERPAADPRDIVLRGKRRHVDGDLRAGWVELADGGELVCTGTLACLGITIDDGGVLRCRELVTNYLAVDNLHRNTIVEATRVRARVVHRVQLALAALIERGGLEAEYQQHHGGDLNPSWDGTTGAMPLLPELYAPGRDPDGPVDIFEDEVRARLRAGTNIFVAGDLLVR
jgi:hypothetical protein